MKSVGRTTPESSKDQGHRIITVTEEEFEALCELAMAVSGKEDGWNITRGFVERWSGKEIDLAPALPIIIKFAKNIELLEEIIQDLRKFKHKWVGEVGQRKEVS